LNISGNGLKKAAESGRTPKDKSETNGQEKSGCTGSGAKQVFMPLLSEYF
jgi:hypothetical protein